MARKQEPYPILIPQGATYRETFKYREDDEVTPIPLTGYATGKGQVRKHQERDAELMAEIQIEVHEEEGEVDAYIPFTVTETLTQNGFYDIFLYHTNGEDAIRFVFGPAELDRQVTDNT